MTSRAGCDAAVTVDDDGGVESSAPSHRLLTSLWSSVIDVTSSSVVDVVVKAAADVTGATGF